MKKTFLYFALSLQFLFIHNGRAILPGFSEYVFKDQSPSKEPQSSPYENIVFHVVDFRGTKIDFFPTTELQKSVKSDYSSKLAIKFYDYFMNTNYIVVEEGDFVNVYEKQIPGKVLKTINWWSDTHLELFPAILTKLNEQYTGIGIEKIGFTQAGFDDSHRFYNIPEELFNAMSGKNSPQQLTIEKLSEAAGEDKKLSPPFWEDFFQFKNSFSDERLNVREGTIYELAAEIFNDRQAEASARSYRAKRDYNTAAAEREIAIMDSLNK